MTPEWLSHSALQQYLKCSWQYKLERVDKLPLPPAWFFMGGSAVHLATARMDERNEYPYTDDQLEHIWSEAWDEVISEAYDQWPDDRAWRQAGRPSKAWPEGQRYSYWDMRGRAAVHAWHDWRIASRVAGIDVMMIEEDVQVTLPSGIVLKGYVDRVMSEAGRKPYILDIKTGTKRPTSPLQLALYRSGLSLKYPGLDLSTQGAWWMAKDEQEFMVELGGLSLDKIDLMAQTYVKGVEQEIFIPNLGDACQTCPFTQQCYAKE